MNETRHETAARIASLLAQGAAVMTWNAPKARGESKVGAIWVDRHDDPMTRIEGRWER